VRSGLRVVVAQRLVRPLCACARPSSGPEDFLGLPVRRAKLPDGCDACQGTGYLGRTVLAEMLLPDSELSLFGPVSRSGCWVRFVDFTPRALKPDRVDEVLVSRLPCRTNP
jgi:hypothetical protein